MPPQPENPFTPPDTAGAPLLVREFWSLWREERFFECHEVLEDLWRETPGAERWFYNALIHCAVSIYHHRAGNPMGAARQLVRAQAKMAPFAPRFGGVETQSLLSWLENEVAASLQALTERQRASVELARRHAEAKVAAAFPNGRFCVWESTD